MKISLKSSLLLGAGLMVAGAVLAESLVIANQRRAPARSLAIGVAPQGAAKAWFSRSLQAARLAKRPNSAPSGRERRLAAEAFAAEPLATPALSVLVQGLAADGQIGKSQRLLDYTGALSRRDNLVNAMLIDGELKRNRPDRAVRLLGRAMAVSYEVRSLYVERMAAATAQPGGLAALSPMLGRNPPWAQDYWDAVLERPAIMPKAGEVRLRIAGAPWKRNRASDSDLRLIFQLANRQQPQLAWDLARALGIKAPPAGELLRNAGFSAAPRFVPFDWDLLQSGDIGATINPGERTMLVSSLPAATGIAARQLVALDPATRYRLQWQLSGLANPADARLKFRLTCAEERKGGAPVEPVTLRNGAASAVIAVPPSSCRWYWAALELDTTLGNTGVDILVRQIALRRDTGQQVAARPPEKQN